VLQIHGAAFATNHSVDVEVLAVQEKSIRERRKTRFADKTLGTPWHSES